MAAAARVRSLGVRAGLRIHLGARKMPLVKLKEAGLACVAGATAGVWHLNIEAWGSQQARTPIWLCRAARVSAERE